VRNGKIGAGVKTGSKLIVGLSQAANTNAYVAFEKYIVFVRLLEIHELTIRMKYNEVQ